MFSPKFFKLSLQIILRLIFFLLFFKPTLTLGKSDCDLALRNFLLSSENPIQLITELKGASFVLPSATATRYSEFSKLDISRKDWEEIVNSYMKSLRIELLGPKEELWQPQIEIITSKDWNDPLDNSIKSEYPYNTAILKIDLTCILCNYFEITLIHELVHLITWRKISKKWAAFKSLDSFHNRARIILNAYGELISDIIPMYATNGSGNEMALFTLEEIAILKSNTSEIYHGTMNSPFFRLRDASINHQSDETFNFLKAPPPHYNVTKVSAHHLTAKARSHAWLRLQALSSQLSLKEAFDLLIDTTINEMVSQSNYAFILSSDQIADLTLENVSLINDSFIDTFEGLLSDLLTAKQLADPSMN